MSVQDYLMAHTIWKNDTPLAGFLCSEVIVDDPAKLAELICRSEEYYISEILWWDRAKLGEGSPLGYGGPRDPRFADEYYFAETFLNKAFSPTAAAEEFAAYFAEVKNAYPHRELYPGFTIALRKNI